MMKHEARKVVLLHSIFMSGDDINKEGPVRLLPNHVIFKLTVIRQKHFQKTRFFAPHVWKRLELQRISQSKIKKNKSETKRGTKFVTDVTTKCQKKIDDTSISLRIKTSNKLENSLYQKISVSHILLNRMWVKIITIVSEHWTQFQNESALTGFYMLKNELPSDWCFPIKCAGY